MELQSTKLNYDAKIHIFDTFNDFAKITSPLLEEGNIAVSGGDTFATIFPLWANQNPKCENSSFFPVDERVVPFDDKDSNWGNATKLFLNPIGKQDDKKHFPTTKEDYLSILKSHFKTDIPIFDVIFLGVGDDGHTASLFPKGKYLDDMDSIVMETISPKLPANRITLSPKVLASAKKVITIVAGNGKKEILKGILNSNVNLPIVKMLSLRKNNTIYIKKDLYDSIQ